MKPVGVIIARFQTPYLHEGHKQLIDYVKERHNKVVIVLGVSPVVGTKRNPYDYHTREKLVKTYDPDLIVLPLADTPSDERWSQNIDTLLGGTFTTEKFVLYGSRDSFINYYFGKNKTEELPAFGDYNATSIRYEISDLVRDSEDFRAGIIYAYHRRYPTVYATVDIAVFRNNKTEVLLGLKEIDNKWRLIGGFSDPTDDSFEEAVLREMKEECGDIEVGNLQYEKSMKVDDWRYRSEEDKIITKMYSADLVFGNPTGSDDIAKVDWYDVNVLQEMIEQEKIVYEHRPMIKYLYDKYTTKK